MSTSRGIFDNLSSNPPSESPFAVVNDSKEQTETPAVASPFAAVSRPDSPFAAMGDSSQPRSPGTEKAQKLPERRKPESPFQLADASEGFGFEAPSPAPSPFEPAPSPVSSPFSPAPAPDFSSRPAISSPFAAATQPVKPEAPVAPTWPTANPSPVSAFQSPAPQAVPVSSPKPETPSFAQESDSTSIRQLELRAIFGVDREMSSEEILQRSRSLPGIRHISRVSQDDMAAVDSIKKMIANLGFGGGGIKLYAGSVPIEFIRENGVMLAVQTDGGFAPGIRETLMIVARELGRSA
ncbi:hypothetical protein JIN85_03970 [Luteolibacter pohnpeiensis]|uniref:Uncharacterized protein n=1 Tax=Luteolibacter pohnpeiensis TaxID=454153 RepID=A0A934VV94_9BACT|nr:hypothetical protein [Luteolibacter pohnpeiensis]MBK1881558.1 hypothetical protein [Luteolibacter pohnpeiensis]